MSWITTFIIFTYLTQIQSAIITNLNEIQLDINNILQRDSLFNCSTYTNDENIIDSFPFYVHRNPFIRYPTMTYALINADDNIYYINIAHQQFVPSTIYCLEHLTELHIRNTTFCDLKYQLPVEIEYFASSLINLSISDTTINYLPEQIGKLSYLESLELSNTSLMALPDTIGALSSLTTLYLPNNKLSSLPTTIKNLRSLSQIILTNNPNLRSIKPLNDHPSLKILDTRHCSIEELPRNLPKLVDLYMSNNNLKTLNYIETLGYETNDEKSFYFNKNSIQSIPRQIRYVRNLYWLNLNYNQLNNLPEDMFRVTTLSRLYIQYNRFRRYELTRIIDEFRSRNPNLTVYCMSNGVQ